MFKTDDTVTYGINGVCKIVGIEEKELLGVKRDYYVLKPVTNDKSTYFVPVDNNNITVKMRKLLTEDEINNILDCAGDEKPQWINNERERKECYKKIVGEANHTELIKMIKAITCEKNRREKQGKKLFASDEKFLRDAEKILCDEFQYVLNLSEKEVLAYIFKRVGKATEE